MIRIAIHCLGHVWLLMFWAVLRDAVPAYLAKALRLEFSLLVYLGHYFGFWYVGWYY